MTGSGSASFPCRGLEYDSDRRVGAGAGAIAPGIVASTLTLTLAALFPLEGAPYRTIGISGRHGRARTRGEARVPRPGGGARLAGLTPDRARLAAWAAPGVPGERTTGSLAVSRVRIGHGCMEGDCNLSDAPVILNPGSSSVAPTTWTPARPHLMTNSTDIANVCSAALDLALRHGFGTGSRLCTPRERARWTKGARRTVAETRTETRAEARTGGRAAER